MSLAILINDLTLEVKRALSIRAVESKQNIILNSMKNKKLFPRIL